MRNEKRIRLTYETSFLQSWIDGLLALVDYYCPLLLVLGCGVRSCTWEGRTPGGGKAAREVLEQCLVLLVHLYGSESPKVEYVRTLSTALLAWQPWMDKLPGCCFIEETCEALLSRMASRCRGHQTISSFEGVSDLFLTLPPVSRALKKSRGQLRDGLLQLFWIRCRRLISHGETNPYVEWSQKGSAFQATMPDDFAFPAVLHTMAKEDLLPVFVNSLRCLRSKSKISGDVENFFRANLPRASPLQHQAEDTALRRLPRSVSRPRRPSVPVVPIAREFLFLLTPKILV